jgi:hypothetical protein
MMRGYDIYDRFTIAFSIVSNHDFDDHFFFCTRQYLPICTEWLRKLELLFFIPQDVAVFTINLRIKKIYLFFSNTILFLFVIDTQYEKQLITPLGYF